MKKEKNVKKDNSKKNNKWWLIPVGILVIALIVFLLLYGCGRKYKITLHYGDETIEVNPNFKLTDLEVEGGKISFLVNSDGHVSLPDEKLDPKKEYSAHIIPDGAETVKVTFKVDKKETTLEYQKGAGLLFPADPVKKGYIFITWKFEDKDDYPVYMMPVNEDMTIVAVFEKSKEEESGYCLLNCDTNKDGACDYNCDVDGDGEPDKNIDTNYDGRPDFNVDKNHDGICDLNCDVDGDGKADTNLDVDGDTIPDLNIQTGRNGSPTRNVDKDGDGKCDSICSDSKIDFLDGEKYVFDTYCTANRVVVPFHKDSVVSVYKDGKEVQPKGYAYDELEYPEYDVSDYTGTGKTLDLVWTIIVTDEVGHKYYQKNQSLITYPKCRAKDDVIKAEYNDSTTNPCNLKGISYQSYADYVMNEAGIKYDVNKSKVKLISEKLGDNSKNAKLVCGLGFGLYWKLEDYNEEFFKAREGKTITDTCVWEIQTEGQKYEFTYNHTIKYDGNCKKEDVIKIEHTEDLSKECGYEYVYYGMPNKYLEQKGLILNENSKFKVLSMHLDGDSNYAYYDCGMSKNGYHWDIGQFHKAEANKFIESRRGKTTTDTCEIEVITDGQKYLVDLKFVTKYSTNCSKDEKTTTTTKPATTTTTTTTTTTKPTTTKKEETTTTTTTTKAVDNGKISLSANKTCLVGNASATLTATVTDTKDTTVTWEKDACITLSGSGTTTTVTANSCTGNATVTAKLNNGAKSSVTITHEQALEVKVYDNNTNTTPICTMGNDGYCPNSFNHPIITTNIPVTFNVSNSGAIASQTSTSLTLNMSNNDIDITSKCGQSATVKTSIVIT